MRFIFFLLTLILFIATISSGQVNKQIFSSPKLGRVVAEAKTVAILPFNVNISYKRMLKGVIL